MSTASGTAPGPFFHPEGRDDNVVRSVGPYVNGEEHGIWTGYDQSGNRLGTIRYENGRALAAPGSALETGAAATVAPLQFASPAARSPPRRVP